MYTCPNCEAQIPLEDINVSKDIALCRTCGQSSSFSDLEDISKVPNLDEIQKPKHIKIEPDFGDGKSVIYKRIHPIVLFLIPFTCVWSGGSMWAIYGRQIIKGKFDLTQSLFGIPFLLGTIVLVSICAFSLFGKWQVSMGNGRGLVFVGLGPFGWKRPFLYHGNTKVSVTTSLIRQNNRPMQCIEIQGGSKNLKFGSGMKQESLEYVAAFMKNEIKKS